MAKVHENATDDHMHSSPAVKSAIKSGASQFQKHHGDGEAAAQKQPFGGKQAAPFGGGKSAPPDDCPGM